MLAVVVTLVYCFAELSIFSVVVSTRSLGHITYPSQLSLAVLGGMARLSHLT